MIANALKTIFDDRFSEHPSVLEQHCENLSWIKRQPPHMVVFVESKEEVMQVVALCNTHDFPLIPFGAGTSLEGQVNAPLGGVCLDLSRMNKILKVYTEDMQVVVQPGVTRQQLNQMLHDTGLFFPVDPGADATLGGMAATRASGTNAVRYGTMKENVMAMEIVLPSGKLIKVGTRAKKSSAGYDLTKLFIGSEGTLGIITELTLKLYGIPESTVSGVCSFETINDACNAVILGNQLGIDFARIELLDVTSIHACNIYSKLNLIEKPTLFLEFHGSKVHTSHEIERFHEVVMMNQGGAFSWANKEEERASLWRARHDAWWAIHSLFPGKKGVSTDVCVPISTLAECIKACQREIELRQLSAAIIGHVGDGNFHVLVLLDPEKEAEVSQVKDFIDHLNRLAIQWDGTCTGEHGVGQGKMDYLSLEHGLALEEMCRIKCAIDPKNRMNPGKLFPVSQLNKNYV